MSVPEPPFQLYDFSECSPLDIGIGSLLRILGNCSEMEQPSAHLLLTLENLLKMRGRQGDFESLVAKVASLEKRIELLGSKEIAPSRRRFGQPIGEGT